MEYIAIFLVALVAIEHVYILVLEMFLWTKPRTLKVFGMTQEEAETSKTLAANQGLYNGFLAAGLFFGLLYPDHDASMHIQMFFLACVMTAAVYGGMTAKRSILIVQGLPATLAMISVIVVVSI